MIFSCTIKVLSSWILNQHSYVKKCLSVSNIHWWISFEKVSNSKVCLSTLFSFLFYFKSPIYLMFVSIFLFVVLLNSSISVSNLHVVTEEVSMSGSNLQNGLMISGMHLQQYHSLQRLLYSFMLVWMP